MKVVGLEPTVFRLKAGRSAFELHSHMAERAELESDTASGTIRLAGGPRTFRVHAPWFGESGRIRTHNPQSRNLLLYPLRYASILAGIAGIEPATCRLTADRSAN